jgi:hypothetical protein
MLRLLACVFLLTTACDLNPVSSSGVEDLLLHVKVVVDKRWSPPICFLANPYYGYQGGPVLTTVPCESVMNSNQEIITINQLPTQSCTKCRKAEEMK